MLGRLALSIAILLGSSFGAAAHVDFTPPEPLDVQEFDLRNRTYWPQRCEDWAAWDKRARSFRVHGQTHYVGTCGISVLLIDSGNGLVMIDTGPANASGHVFTAILHAGFDYSNVELLLQSHEHFDHIGGLSRFRRFTGARVMASPNAALVIERGQVGSDDPQADILEAFAPALVDGIVIAGEPILIGDLRLMPIATPGHTPGALSWQWESCDDTGDCKTIVYADSLSPVSSDSYRFSDHPEYVQAYRDGIARLAALDCDILLTPHPSASGMRDKLIAGDLASGMNCAEYAASITARLDARLAEEAAQ